MTLPDKIPDLPGWAWAGIGIAAAWLLFRPKDAGSLAASAGKGVVNVTAGVFSGLTEGLFGIPQTNEQKCKAALAANDGTAASLYCPAGTLIAAIPQSFADWFKGLANKPVAPSGHGAFSGNTAGYTSGAANPPASVLDSNILNGQSFEDLSQSSYLDSWLGNWIEDSNSQNRTLYPVNQATPVAGLRG
jgi:hypothetical protein